jgi:AraC family transcriptional regulator
LGLLYASFWRCLLIASIGQSLKAELTTGQHRNQLYVNSLTTTLAAHLIQHYCTVKQPIRDEARGLPAYQVQRAIDYIHSYLDRNIQLTDIATAPGMSQYYFARSFQQATGISPYQYLLGCRIERAKQLLKQPELAIADIALQCDFNSQSHLHQHFRKITGITPKAYRNA